jgi:hypothetical protein
MQYGQTSKIVLDSGTEVDGIRVSAKKKTAIIRFPTAKEQDDYTLEVAKRRTKDEEDEPDYKAELDLFKKLRLDVDGEEWDEYEARYLVDRLLSVRNLGAVQTGDEQVITLQTQFGLQVHTLREPSFKDMTLYERAVNKLRGSKPSFAHIHKLYNSLMVKTEGYPDSFADTDIPVEHKYLCVEQIRIEHYKLDPIQIDPNA